MKLLLIAILNICIVAIAYADNGNEKSNDSIWSIEKNISDAFSSNSSDSYFVANSFSSFGNINTAWIVNVFTSNEVKVLGGSLKDSSYTKEKCAFDCLDKKIQVYYRIIYDIKSAKAIAATKIDDGWQDVYPNTVGEQQFNYVCMDKKLISSSKTDSFSHEINNILNNDGVVVEVLQTDGYSYVKVLTDKLDFEWLATPTIKINVGDKIKYTDTTALTNFTSKTLMKTFKKVKFVTEIVNMYDFELSVQR